MNIGLCSAPMRDNDIAHQLMVMEDMIKANPGHDLMIFGESFLQGFEGLTWNTREDLIRACATDGPVIGKLRDMARQHGCAISFGFIERAGGALYSSNLLIDSAGETADLFRRVSPGWKEPRAGAACREGEGFHTFALMGKVFAAAICGDLWYEENIKALNRLDFDCLLWPLYVDYSLDKWQSGALDEYIAQTAKIKRPCLMVNSFVDDPKRAKGGCYVFDKGKAVSALPMGNTGVLSLVL
jgi:N-carbamoylputrescine amidase